MYRFHPGLKQAPIVLANEAALPRANLTAARLCFNATLDCTKTRGKIVVSTLKIVTETAEPCRCELMMVKSSCVRFGPTWHLFIRCLAQTWRLHVCASIPHWTLTKPVARLR
jgi:hypothetical protein